MTEEAKKRSFLEGITDLALESVKIIFYASPVPFPTFETLQQFFKTYMISLGATKGTPSGNRPVSQTAQNNPRRAGRGGRAV